MTPHPPTRAEFVVVLLGGLGLAAGAGYVNTLVLAMGAMPVTHLTGTISRLSGDVGRGDTADALIVLRLVVAFFLGAMASGVIIGSSTLHLGRRYGVAVMVEALLLSAAAATIGHNLSTGATLAAAAAGLQNAMASSYRSLIVRTTHVTGVMTDLGFLVGQLIGGHKVERWRFALLTMLLTAFAGGGVLGAIAHHQIGAAGLWLPAGGLAVGGATYFAWRLHARRHK